MSLSLRAKTNLVFYLALAALAVIGWFSFRENRSMVENDRLVSHTRAVLETSESLASHLAEASAARAAYFRLNDAKQIDAFLSASKSALSDFAELRKLTVGDTDQSPRVIALAPLVRGSLSILKESVEHHQRTIDDLKEQNDFSENSARVATQFLNLIHKFDNVEKDALQRPSAAAQISNQWGTKINEFLSASVFLLLILALGFLNRALSRRELAEGAAAEQKELLQSILDSCSDAVTVANSSGAIVLRNPVAARNNAGTFTNALNDDYAALQG